MSKISVITILITFFVPISTLGQIGISNYGLKVGVQSASAYSDLSTDGRVIGFGVYGFADWEINKKFFSTLDLGITQRGFSNSQIQTDETGEFIQKVESNSKLTYASIASFFNIKTKFSKLQPYIGIGPRLDLLVNKSLGVYEFSNSSFQDQTANGLDDVVFGASINAGIRNLAVEGMAFRVDLKYEVDITDSFSNFTADYRNNAIMLVLGVSL